MQVVVKVCQGFRLASVFPTVHHNICRIMAMSFISQNPTLEDTPTLACSFDGRRNYVFSFLPGLSRSFFGIVDPVPLRVDNDKLSAPGLCLNCANLRASASKLFVSSCQICDFNIQMEMITLRDKFNTRIGIINPF